MRLTIWTDGGSRGNPGPAAAGIIISTTEGRIVCAQGYYLGEATNNVAEYEGILRGLQEAEKLGGTEIELFSDSELLVKQITGKFRVKSEHLRPYYQKVMEQIDRYEKVTVKHVPRSKNTRADELVNRALDARADINRTRPSNSKETHQKDVPLPSHPKGEPFLKSVDVLEKAKAAEGGLCQEILSEENGFICELVCLPPGQEIGLGGDRSQTAVTVLSGRGVLEAEEQKQVLKAGVWLQWGAVREIHISAHAGEPLVVVLTRQS